MSWLIDLPRAVPDFLARLARPAKPGFYHYSLSGDLYDEHTHWGLGNAVFATKILYVLKQLTPSLAPHLVSFISRFRAADHTFYDPLIKNQAFWAEKIQAVLKRNFQNFWHQQVIAAETRQSLAALQLLGKPDRSPARFIPTTPVAVTKLLNRLDWSRPWGAGSHFSHLLFFLQNSSLENKQLLINEAIRNINQLQHPTDGAWYDRTTNLQHKVNGAMKVITGLQAVNQPTFSHATALIDLCLNVPNDQDACSNFNSIYVLYHATRQASGYRAAGVRHFATQRLDTYQRYYFPAHGGFSFLPSRAGTHYYGVRITRGLPEPDIHGTVMFLWGLSLITRLLDLPEAALFQPLPA